MGKKLKESKQGNLFGLGRSKRCKDSDMYVGNFSSFYSSTKKNDLVFSNVPAHLFPDAFVSASDLGRDQVFELLRRSKHFLSMRCPSFSMIEKLERRRLWNRAARPIESNLDLFPSVKYSYSSVLPIGSGNVSVSVSERGKRGARARFVGVACSNNMRLDPVDASRVAYKRRLEIVRAITWGYCNDFVPVMLTLTLYHDWTWDPLAKLIAVLRGAYGDLFGHNIGGRLKNEIGFRYRIYRMEETLDAKNGWHPHYHIILFVPKSNLQIASDLEPKLKERWVKLVTKYYRAILGKELPDYASRMLYKHGLRFSRWDDGVHGRESGPLRGVDDSVYLNKIMGLDSAFANNIYAGDAELSNLRKETMTPFDLLRGDITAEKVDLWNEYAVATKGLSVFRFTPGFKAVIDDYFKNNPQADPISHELPQEKILATIDQKLFKLLYRNFKLGELKQKAAQGLGALYSWLEELLASWGLSDWMQLFVCYGGTVAYNESVTDDMIASDVGTADDEIVADSETVMDSVSVADSLSSAASVSSVDVECRPLS